MRRLPALLTCLVLAAGCTGDDKPDPAPDPNAAANEARGRLAVLAQATANGAYDATYEFVQRPTNATGVIRIRQRPPEYRIDVIGKREVASFFALRSGSIVSCSKTSKKRTCFLVARAGEEVPGLFDPGVQRLFRDAVQDLAANPTGYAVTPVPEPTGAPSAPGTTPSPAGSPAGAPSGSPSAPAGGTECFAVTRTEAVETPGGARPGFENGTYCFDEARGVATRIDVASGTLLLTKTDPAPDAKAFEPITKVQRLPELTPTPTPKK